MARERACGRSAGGQNQMTKTSPTLHRRQCPVAAFQKLISGKYKLRILWDLQDGPRRYSEIRSGLLRGAGAGTGEIAPRVLSRELKALAAGGMIDRKDFGLVPPRVEYRLTRKGKSFIPVVAAIRDWGARHLDAVTASIAEPQRAEVRP
jgi:DNA-binding HxlR family transcriptional regulator